MKLIGYIFFSHSSCVPTGHQEPSQRVTVPYAACIQLYPVYNCIQLYPVYNCIQLYPVYNCFEHLMLETCRGEYCFMNK